MEATCFLGKQRVPDLNNHFNVLGLILEHHIQTVSRFERNRIESRAN